MDGRMGGRGCGRIQKGTRARARARAAAAAEARAPNCGGSYAHMNGDECTLTTKALVDAWLLEGEPSDEAGCGAPAEGWEDDEPELDFGWCSVRSAF